MMRPAFCLGLLAIGLLNGAPLISPGGIVNSASFTPPLSPGGAIAQGSIFSIFGAQLGPDTGVQPSVFPLGVALGGVSIKVMQGAISLDAIPLYASAGLINALMPSNAPTGKVSVQVTYNGTKSNLEPALIAANAPGIYTATGGGIGPGILQNFVSGPELPINSASATATPGQVAILWLTGLGPIKAADNQPPPTGNLPFTAEVWVGGMAVTNIAYSGRTPCCAGVDEIVFTLPANVPTGCFVPVTVRAAGKAVSNTVTMAIDANGSACSDAASPYTGAVTQGKRSGIVLLSRNATHSDSGTLTDVTVDSAVATFVSPSGSGFIFNSAVAVPPAGSCNEYSGKGNFLGGVPQFAFPTVDLDPGALTLSGTSVTKTFTRTTPNGASFLKTPSGSGSTSPAFVSSGAPLFLNPGAFTIAAAGGADVGAFSASVTIAASSLTWTNRDQITTVDRTKPLTLSWSGSSGTVEIQGTTFDAGSNASTVFQCLVPAGANSFTVPAWILANLSPSPAALNNSQAEITLAAVAPLAPFTAPGLDAGSVLVVSSQSKVVTVQ